MTKQRTLPAGAIVAAAIGLGFAGDQLIRDSQGPGLNFLLLFVGLATSVWIVKQSGGPSLSREAYGWIWVGLACGAALIWRGSPLLRIAALFGALTAFAIPALRAGRPWVRRAGITAYLEAVFGKDGMEPSLREAATELHEGFTSIQTVATEYFERIAHEVSESEDVDPETDPRVAMGRHLEGIAQNAEQIAEQIAEGGAGHTLEDYADDLKALADDLDDAMEVMKEID